MPNVEVEVEPADQGTVTTRVLTAAAALRYRSSDYGLGGRNFAIEIPTVKYRKGTPNARHRPDPAHPRNAAGALSPQPKM